ncbi:MAG: hypothetical protein ACR2KP_08745 [Egibacteraceae bacterium]
MRAADADAAKRSAADVPSRSGTRFVVACTLGLVAFVVFLAVVSPRLLERTQAAAPPPAPQRVGAGTVGGQAWVATAVERDEEEPCLRVALGEATGDVCGQRQGGGVLQAVTVRQAGEAALLTGVMTASVGTLEVEVGSNREAVRPVYVDFGFPAAFVAAEIPAGQVRLIARDRDDEVIATGACPADGACETVTVAD